MISPSRCSLNSDGAPRSARPAGSPAWIPPSRIVRLSEATAEAEPWIRGDEVERIGRQLDLDVRTSIEHAVETEVETAFRLAEEAAFPSDEELLTDVFQ